MSLSSSLFSGISGLSAMGNAMQVVGDNISNVNTIGFKSGSVTFQDLLSQSMATLSGTSQVGRGAGMGQISQSFSQGSFESTGNTTDLAIGGEGFFIVGSKDSEETFYTRAGNFSFDNDGYLTNPKGLVVQGWEMQDGEDIGSVKDVRLTSFTSPPEKSTKVTLITNLDSDAESKSEVLASAWDSSATSPLATSAYQYQSIVKVYDSLGSTHDLTIYYDKKSGSAWEYAITCNPNEDMRNLVQDTDSTGLLAKGTITFGESSGKINDITMQSFTGRIGGIDAGSTITKDEVSFQIKDSTKLDAGDGYGMKLSYDGTKWSLDSASLPFNYRNATTLRDDGGSTNEASDKALIDLDGDNAVDMIVNLSKAAQGDDYINFDINSKTDLHVRNIENMLYSGDTTGDNTTMAINNPDALTRDLKQARLEWKYNYVGIQNYGPKNENGWISQPVKEEVNPNNINKDGIDTSRNFVMSWNGSTWAWGGPTNHNYSDTGRTGVSEFNTSMTINDSTAFNGDTITNADPIILTYTAATTSWALTGGGTSYPAIDTTPTGNADSVEVDLNGDGSADLTYNFSTPLTADGILTFDTSTWTPVDAGYTKETIIRSTDSGISLGFTDNEDLVDLKFSFASVQNSTSFSFNVVPTAASASWTLIKPPVIDAEYSSGIVGAEMVINEPNNLSTNSTEPYSLIFDGVLGTWSWDTSAGNYSPESTSTNDYPNVQFIKNSSTELSIDFNGDNMADLTYNFTSTTDASTIIFNIEKIYEKYDISKGDKDSVEVNIDGDDANITDFTFSFGSSLNSDSIIRFDIKGTTAWENQDKNKDLNEEGYFQFSTDFLGSTQDDTSTKIAFDIGSKYNSEKGFINDSLTSTQYSRASTTTYQTSNGYGAGDLQSIDVSSEGEMTGIYSNGQITSLYRIALAKFQNNQGLYKEGGNLFRATRNSGNALYNKPGTNGLGTIAPNSLEQSNVDIANEFVKMITNQRGFQANSKIITTVDSMLTEAINMKR